MIEYTKYGQPVVIASCTMAGSTGPITLAGTIALSNAEILAGIAVAQLLREGTPVFYGNQTTTADMKTGSIAIDSADMIIHVHSNRDGRQMRMHNPIKFPS